MRRTGRSDTRPEIEAMMIAAFARMPMAEKLKRVHQDGAYLEETAEALGVSDLLDEALTESGA